VRVRVGRAEGRCLFGKMAEVTATASEEVAAPMASQPSATGSSSSLGVDADQPHRMNSTELSSSDDVDVISNALVRQVEWYLGRSNLSTDYFLMQQMREDFFVQLGVLGNFPKMKRMLAGRDLAFLASVIRERSSELELDASGTSVRPLFALKEKRRSVLMLRDVPSTLNIEEINALFSSHSQQPESIRPDVGDTWFITFDSPDGAKAALEHIKDATLNGAPIKARVKMETIARTLAAAAPSSAPLPGPGGPMGMPAVISAQQQQQMAAAMMAGGAPPPGTYLPYGFVPAPGGFRPGPAPPPGAVFAPPPPHFAAQIAAMVPPGAVPAGSQQQQVQQAGLSPGSGGMSMVGAPPAPGAGGVPGYGAAGGVPQVRPAPGGGQHGRDGGGGASGAPTRHGNSGGGGSGGNHRGAPGRARGGQSATAAMQPRAGSYPPGSGDQINLAHGGMGASLHHSQQSGASVEGGARGGGGSGRRNNTNQSGPSNSVGSHVGQGPAGGGGQQAPGLQKKKKGTGKKDGGGDSADHGSQRRKAQAGSGSNSGGQQPAQDGSGFGSQGSKKEVNLLTESFPPLSGAGGAQADGANVDGTERAGGARAEAPAPPMDTAWKSPIPAATHAMPAPKQAAPVAVPKPAESRANNVENGDVVDAMQSASRSVEQRGSRASGDHASGGTLEGKSPETSAAATGNGPAEPVSAAPSGDAKPESGTTGDAQGSAKSYAAILRAAKKPDPVVAAAANASSGSVTGSGPAPERENSNAKKPGSPQRAKSAAASESSNGKPRGSETQGKDKAGGGSPDIPALSAKKTGEDGDGGASSVSPSAAPAKPVSVWANKPRSVLEKPTAPVVSVQTQGGQPGASQNAPETAVRRKFSSKGGSSSGGKAEPQLNPGAEKVLLESPGAKVMDENVV